eukprot:m.97224 g.97224  ORF g.97224 m.97224 type:complete len:397 (-) comp8984_c0_seq1:29-1219(-)
MKGNGNDCDDVGCSGFETNDLVLTKPDCVSIVGKQALVKDADLMNKDAAIAFIQQQHKSVLQSLRDDVAKLQQKNRDLNYKIVILEDDAEDNNKLIVDLRSKLKEKDCELEKVIGRRNGSMKEEMSLLERLKIAQAQMLVLTESLDERDVFIKDLSQQLKRSLEENNKLSSKNTQLQQLIDQKAEREAELVMMAMQQQQQNMHHLNSKQFEDDKEEQFGALHRRRLRRSVSICDSIYTQDGRMSLSPRPPKHPPRSSPSPSVSNSTTINQYILDETERLRNVDDISSRQPRVVPPIEETSLSTSCFTNDSKTNGTNSGNGKKHNINDNNDNDMNILTTPSPPKQRTRFIRKLPSPSQSSQSQLQHQLHTNTRRNTTNNNTTTSNSKPASPTIITDE